MPFHFSDQVSDSGMSYLRVDAEGVVELEHAEALTAQLERPEVRGGKVLSVVAMGTDYKPKARKHFQTLNDKFSSLAAVVTSPVLRTAINFMLRLWHDDKGVVRLFTDEAEALAWLEAQP